MVGIIKILFYQFFVSALKPSMKNIKMSKPKLLKLNMVTFWSGIIIYYLDPDVVFV